MLRSVFMLLALAALSACASLTNSVFNSVTNLTRLNPGISNEEDVTRLAGKPGYVWNNSDGTRTLEYSNQPYDGFNCFMVMLAADGKVLKVEQAITNQNLDKVQQGMTQAEVRRLLGEPRRVQYFPLSGEEVWDWNTGDWGLGSITRFNAHFINAKLARTSTSRVDLNDCGPFGWCL